MKFFPPSQLPPMQGRGEEPSEESSPPKPVSLKRRIAYVVLSLPVGFVLAAVGHNLSGSPASYAAVPIALAIGWCLGSNPEQSRKSTLQRSGDRPVLW